jgi:hypothetical protein
MSDLSVSVQDWRYLRGWDPGSLPLQGWHCWVTTDQQSAFILWMDANCPDADVQLLADRYRVHIRDAQSAVRFTAAWSRTAASAQRQ